MSGTLTIQAGETTGTIYGEIRADGVVEEEDETFTVKLSGAEWTRRLPTMRDVGTIDGRRRGGDRRRSMPTLRD